MSWARFDDQFNNHPKVLAAGPLAQLLHMKAIIYCAQYLTDGLVPHEAIDLLVNWGEGQACWVGDSDFFENSEAEVERVYASDLADRLVACGLWEETGSGWQIHDYLDWNPSGCAVKERKDQVRRVRSEAGRRGGKAKRKQNGSKTEANVEAKAKQKEAPSPSPSPSPSQLERDSGFEFTKLSDIEPAGYERYGGITGAAIASIRRLLPISAAEFDAAMSTKGNSWSYAAKVIESYRTESDRGPGPKQRTPTIVEYVRQFVPEWMPGTPGGGNINDDKVAQVIELKEEYARKYPNEPTTY